MKLLKNFRHMKCGCRHLTIQLHPEKLDKSVSKYVVVSESRDIFENLALEDWFYENYDLSKREILLLWRNTPAVVIGRHQNPWLEANIEESISKGIQIVRRNSGGGTVYHDLGNLNLSFLSNRKVYDRVRNLDVIVKSLKKEWSIKTYVNSRSDVMINKKKISGTASKLSRKNAYHHCTLLVDVNKYLLSTSLRSPTKSLTIDTSATSSKPASIMNLREVDSSINIDRLVTIIGLEYLSSSNSGQNVEPRGFHLVKPSNDFFSGIDKRINKLKSWEWIYGRTPKFVIASHFVVNKDAEEQFTVDFQIKIEAATICDIIIKTSPQLDSYSTIIEHCNVSFLGKKFSEMIVSELKKMFYDDYHDGADNSPRTFDSPIVPYSRI